MYLVRMYLLKAEREVMEALAFIREGSKYNNIDDERVGLLLECFVGHEGAASDRIAIADLVAG